MKQITLRSQRLSLDQHYSCISLDKRFAFAFENCLFTNSNTYCIYRKIQSASLSSYFQMKYGKVSALQFQCVLYLHDAINS